MTQGLSALPEPKRQRLDAVALVRDESFFNTARDNVYDSDEGLVKDQGRPNVHLDKDLTPDIHDIQGCDVDDKNSGQDGHERCDSDDDLDEDYPDFLGDDYLDEDYLDVGLLDEGTTTTRTARVRRDRCSELGWL